MRPQTIAADPGADVAAGASADKTTPVARSLWPGLALAMAGSIAFSGKAIIVKLAYRYGVDAVTLIMYRMLFALPLFALLAWWAGRGRPAVYSRMINALVHRRTARCTCDFASGESASCPLANSAARDC